MIVNLCFSQLVVATVGPCGEMIWWKRGAEPQKVTVEYLKKCLDEKKAQELVKAYQEPCVSSTASNIWFSVSKSKRGWQLQVSLWCQVKMNSTTSPLCQLVFFWQWSMWWMDPLETSPILSFGIAFWSGKNCWKSMVGCHLCWFPSFPGCRCVLFLSELIIGFLHNGCFIFKCGLFVYTYIYIICVWMCFLHNSSDFCWPSCWRFTWPPSCRSSWEQSIHPSIPTGGKDYWFWWFHYAWAEAGSAMMLSIGVGKITKVMGCWSHTPLKGERGLWHVCFFLAQKHQQRETSPGKMIHLKI